MVAFDYFRAIAILIIIAGHSNVPWHINTLAEKMLVIMVKGGTSLFVFVSGFFLCYRYAKDFSLSTFMAAKTKFVLLPYVIITTLGYAFYLWSDADLPFYQLSGSGLPNILWDHVWDHVWDHAQLLGTYLLYGKISGAYWYIPFIFCVFLLSPLYLSYSRANTRLRVVLLLFAFLVSSAVHRPESNLNVIHSIVYFTPLYFLGINVGLQWQNLKQPIERFCLVFGAIALVLAGLQASFSDVVDNLHKQNMFTLTSFDYMIWQKASLSLFFLGLCLRLQRFRLPALKTVASASFALYFLHEWVLMAMSNSAVITEFRPSIELLSWFYTIAIALGISLVIATAIKFVLGLKSRYVIGW